MLIEQMDASCVRDDGENEPGESNKGRGEWTARNEKSSGTRWASTRVTEQAG
jgi:hypothetical protein